MYGRLEGPVGVKAALPSSLNLRATFIPAIYFVPSNSSQFGEPERIGLLA
jgi:hypothetical protein